MDYGTTTDTPSMHSNETSIAVLPVEDDLEEIKPPMTKQQKLIKAGLLLALVAIIVYVILDYTVS